jgi:DNA topoisomerase-2
MKLKTFFDEEFKQFSIYDTYRSIPSLVDGFKPSQRKVIYAAMKRGENASEIKVSQLASFVSEKTSYHHGEASLESTIVGLAQNYPGANNINLLEPEGQFGSRLTPENAAARYIFTYLTKNFRDLFKKDDDIILNYLDDEGQQIEPQHYYPILPTVLINGSKGMGTGFATTILNYNPKDLKKWIAQDLRGQENSKQLTPWYKGFSGKIHRNDDGQVIIEGKYEIINSTTIKITELPVGLYQDKYKTHLIKLQDRGIIRNGNFDIEDASNEERWEFILTVPRSTTKFSHDKIMETFKLISRDTENYTLWTEDGKIKKFENIEAIVNHFTKFRLLKYEERRLKQIEVLNNELQWLKEKYRFVEFYIKNHIKFAKKNKKQLFEMLDDEEFAHIDKLLSLSIYSLTSDEIKKLKIKIKDIQSEIGNLKNTNAKEMYIKELEELKL